MTIWKYPLEITGSQEVVLPQGARILCVQVQHDVPCLWALVNPDEPSIPRRIYIFGTGHVAPVSAEGYIGTFQTNEGQFVGHVFERSE